MVDVASGGAGGGGGFVAADIEPEGTDDERNAGIGVGDDAD